MKMKINPQLCKIVGKCSVLRKVNLSASGGKRCNQRWKKVESPVMPKISIRPKVTIELGKSRSWSKRSVPETGIPPIWLSPTLMRISFEIPSKILGIWRKAKSSSLSIDSVSDHRPVAGPPHKVLQAGQRGLEVKTNGIKVVAITIGLWMGFALTLHRLCKGFAWAFHGLCIGFA